MYFFFNHNQKYFCTSYSQFYYMFCVYSLLMKLRYTVTYNLKETGFYILLDDILKLPEFRICAVQAIMNQIIENMVTFNECNMLIKYL